MSNSRVKLEVKLFFSISAGLIYLVALPRKMAKCVAAELEKYFGFVGYPSIFHTGMFIIAFPQSNTLTSNYHLTKMYSFISFQTNGKEFIATVVVELLKANNPNCFLVTGRPSTLCSQGSLRMPTS